MTPSELERLADAVAERVAARLATVDTDALVDVHRAAELVGCSVPTIERLTRSGVIPSMKIGRLRRYRPSDLLGKSKGGAA
jgi:excisionase family DNA binding protein